MKHPISIRYCGMTIAGTVESPDARPVRAFGWDATYDSVVWLRRGDAGYPWREIAAEPEPIDGILG